MDIEKNNVFSPYCMAQTSGKNADVKFPTALFTCSGCSRGYMVTDEVIQQAIDNRTFEAMGTHNPFALPKTERKKKFALASAALRNAGTTASGKEGGKLIKADKAKFQGPNLLVRDAMRRSAELKAVRTAAKASNPLVEEAKRLNKGD